jgi:hypothetical protein
MRIPAPPHMDHPSPGVDVFPVQRPQFPTSETRVKGQGPKRPFGWSQGLDQGGCLGGVAILWRRPRIAGSSKARGSGLIATSERAKALR